MQSLGVVLIDSRWRSVKDETLGGLAILSGSIRPRRGRIGGRRAGRRAVKISTSW